MGYFQRRKTETVELQKVEVSFLGIKGSWIADRKQQTAAWEMYVELVTRIAVQKLGPEEGLIREALSSLYALFGETRRILRAYGPSVAQTLPGSETSFGQIAIQVLNGVLRPVLAKWHPLLRAHEALKPPDVSPREHERSWEQHIELRQELEQARIELAHYADLLASASGITSLHTASIRKE